MISPAATAFLSATTLALLLSTGAASAQTIVDYGPEGPMVLVTPDGRVLDGIPEQGSVDVYWDPDGRRVLVGRDGRKVATEVPLDQLEGKRGYDRLPRSTRRGDVERQDLPSRRDQGGYTGLDRSRIPVIAAPDTQPQGNANNRTDTGNDAERPISPTTGNAEPSAADKLQVARLQVMLDRAGASPGVIDGRMGGNVNKALDAYATMTGQHPGPKDREAIRSKLMETGGPAFQKYTITPSDAAGPYVASVPSDYGKKAEMKQLGYTSTAEMLAERFHMDEDYLKALNPGANLSVPGTEIKVARPGRNVTGSVSLIVADKTKEQVRAYDANGNLLAAYPTTIGSTDTPSPSGTVTVEAVAKDPTYTYNPKINFKQGSNDKALTIPPGPNGPVGNMWIDLSKPTYGIHGTPEPSLIGKTNSHGCVRLTNWDAAELAAMVKKGVTVKFVGG
ncbi:L,D-transpeptidase [Pararhizobium mangrovi]|uniref:L,D-transpeptidase n=2 Tax=Pararhizobium mangrovi TaxID=2590452 RepID=A0A506UBF8_9HYPH|nr:L,D-transpeptidase [Pararhizobium mangrovi]